MASSRRSPHRPLKLEIPLSTSNIGPGFDAFSVAVDHHLKLSWTPAERNELVRKGAIRESMVSQGSDPVFRGYRRAGILAGYKLPSGRFEVESDLPPGRGLGASGAGIVGGLLIGTKLAGKKIDRNILLAEAIQLEGHPENATAAMLGGAHWSVKQTDGKWLHMPVSLHRDLRFLVVIPPYQLSTRRAREVLPTSVSFQRAAAQARRTPILLEGLAKLDEEMIRIGIQDELHVEQRLKHLAGAASVLNFTRKAGAIAATLSGAGSALLVLTRTGSMTQVEQRLKRYVKRLWGESGQVVRARVHPKGAL
jgi:homoserine kinase